MLGSNKYFFSETWYPGHLTFFIKATSSNFHYTVSSLETPKNKYLCICTIRVCIWINMLYVIPSTRLYFPLQLLHMHILDEHSYSYIFIYTGCAYLHIWSTKYIIRPQICIYICKRIYLYLAIHICTYSLIFAFSVCLSAGATCAGILRSTREHIVSIKVVRVEFLTNKPLLSGKCNNYSAF